MGLRLGSAEAPVTGDAPAGPDPLSGVAVFEPVGVHPEFRGRGLLAAAMTEAMSRLAAAGVRKARVATAHFNAAAIAAYDKVFDRAGATSSWSLALQQVAENTRRRRHNLGRWRRTCRRLPGGGPGPAVSAS